MVAVLSYLRNNKDSKVWGTSKEVVGKVFPVVHSPSDASVPSLGENGCPEDEKSYLNVHVLQEEYPRKPETDATGA